MGLNDTPAETHWGHQAPSSVAYFSRVWQYCSLWKVILDSFEMKLLWKIKERNGTERKDRSIASTGKRGAYSVQYSSGKRNESIPCDWSLLHLSLNLWSDDLGPLWPTVYFILLSCFKNKTGRLKNTRFVRDLCAIRTKDCQRYFVSADPHNSKRGFSFDSFSSRQYPAAFWILCCRTWTLLLLTVVETSENYQMGHTWGDSLRTLKIYILWDRSNHVL